MAPSNMEEMWREASKRYAKKSGKRLEDLPKPRSTDELMQQVEQENNRYEDFRANKGTLFKILGAAMKPVELVGNLAAGAASAVFPASGTVFGAAMYLINAAKGVSASLDAIAGLMEHLKDFTIGLNVYNKAAMSKELMEQLIETLVTVVEIFARATKKIKEGTLGRFMSFGKNVLLGDDTKMQALLAKLENLTKTEGHLVGAETLVEVKNAGKDVQAIHVAVKEQSTAMATLQFHAQEQSSVLVEMRNEAREEKVMKHVQELKLLLQPSAAPQARLDEIQREHVPGSGDWIRLEDALTTWVDPNEQPLLWISGNPGCGKSFLTYNIIKYIHELAENDASEVSDDASVAYFFFRDNDAKTQSVQQALYDMAYQLTQHSPVYAKYLAVRAPSPGEIASIRTAWSILFADYWLGDEGNDLAYLCLDGLDESLPADREILFEVLKDVRDAGESSRIRIVMLGRPQVIDELVTALENDPPTIHVEPSKNGADIARYIEASINKSRALNKASKKLKTTVIESLTQKAGGMFMWVKLMILDLNRKAQRLRESDVQRALQQAPKGLTDMIKHVLEGYSSSISDDEASDLNDMLMWVSLARRPLLLGELDAVLRLKSEEGEGLIDLEGNLRRNFASLFTLSRDDGLSTAELLASKREYKDDEETVTGAEEGEGEDDLNFPSQFDSNPKTTTVSFSHASISEFFRDHKQGKVRAAGDDCPEVGVNPVEAQIQIVRLCTDIITDKNLRERMKEAVSLAYYAGWSWAEQLGQADFMRATDDDKIAIGTNVARMMCDKELFPEWAWYRRTHFYFSDNFAKPMLPWLKESLLCSKLDGEISTKLSCINDDNALDIFEPVLRFDAQRWLAAPYGSAEYSGKVVPTLIHSWQARKRGETVQETPKLTSEHITSVARWADLEENAEWHRRLAVTFRESELYDEAKKHFENALELDSGMWLAQMGIAKLHYRRKEYDAAIRNYEAVLSAVELDTTHGYDEKFKDLAGRYCAHYDMAQCYLSMAGQIDNAYTRATFTLNAKAHEHLQLAVKYEPTDYESFAKVVYFYHVITTWDALEDDPTRGQGAKHLDMPNVPTNEKCYQHIMQSARSLDDTLRNDKHTNFVHTLMEYKYESDNYYQGLVKAARETGELEWLQDRYRAAISAAKKDLQPVTTACLNLCLADMLYKYGDRDRAMHIWETIGSGSGETARLQTGIAFARWQALNKLGMYCIVRAFEDESQAGRWVEKMERIVARTHCRRGAAINALDSVPPKEMALYLAAWYCKQGRDGEARELVKPHVKDALDILSDDNPRNDIEGYISLAIAFLMIDDDANALAVLQSIRPMKKGVAVLASDKNDSGATGAAVVERADEEAEESEAREKHTNVDPNAAKHDNQDQDEESEPDDKYWQGEIDRWYCGGICGRSFTNFDNAIVCRIGCASFCQSCYASFLEDKIPFRVCSRAHDHLKIPVLETRFKEGELMLDGRVVSLDDWKKSIKKSWGL